MRLCFVISWIGTHALASPQEDAQLIVDHLMTEDLTFQIQNAMLAEYANDIEELLAARSVRVVDKTGLVEVLADHVPAVQATFLKQRAFEFVLQGEQPDRLAEIADFLRLVEQGEASYETPDFGEVDLSEPGFLAAWRAAVGDLERTSGFGEFIDEDAAASLFSFRLLLTMANEVEVDLSAPFLPDVIEESGPILAFPNRILRKDMIDELRAI
jgi:hypothetical protein